MTTVYVYSLSCRLSICTCLFARLCGGFGYASGQLSLENEEKRGLIDVINESD